MTAEQVRAVKGKFIVALTGGIGSGKSEVARLFASYKIDIVDTDKIARELLHPDSELLITIVARYGKDILCADGSLDRAKMRKIIFTNLDEKKWLESLLHPFIYRQMYHQILSTKSIYCIVVIPLLIETHMPYPVDRILVVDAKEQQQIQRTMQRDHLSEQEVKNIIAVQATRESRLKIADDVIDNSKDKKHLQQQVAVLHRLYSDIQ